jgi:hypothetical protein
MSDNRTPSNQTVSYDKIAPDLAAKVAFTALDVNWNMGAIFTKTLTAATTLTFSNVKLNKVITLIISGAYTLTLPIATAYVQGTYATSKINKIQIHCTNATSGSEEYWAVITTT